MSEIEAAEYRPAAVLSISDAAQLVQTVHRAKAEVLSEGTDYMTLPSARVPSLLQPGAEKLLQLFGLGFRMERLWIDYQHAESQVRDGITYRCVVLKGATEIASAEGYAGYDEARFYSPPRDNKPEYRAPWNTVMQMAQKRALVAAAKHATASSGLFTQDIEDLADPLEELRQGVFARWEGLTSESKAELKRAAKAAGLPSDPKEFSMADLLDFHSLVIRADYEVIDGEVVE